LKNTRRKPFSTLASTLAKKHRRRRWHWLFEQNAFAGPLPIHGKQIAKTPDVTGRGLNVALFVWLRIGRGLNAGLIVLLQIGKGLGHHSRPSTPIVAISLFRQIEGAGEGADHAIECLTLWRTGV